MITFDWFKSCFSDRKQYTIIHGSNVNNLRYSLSIDCLKKKGRREALFTISLASKKSPSLRIFIYIHLPLVLIAVLIKSFFTMYYLLDQI